ncbi:MAG: oxidoreductase [Pirellulaceae bacterium]|nr:oxidoreductase [Pirellulaceae bacterium]
MESLLALVCLPILCLLAFACLPSPAANSHARTVRQLVTWVVGGECLLATGLAISHTASGPAAWTTSLGLPDSSLRLGLYFDGATGLMLVLVSFIGLVVSRFSIRYLDGEATQGRYYRWLAFTMGAVSLMVVAGNLLLFFAAWVGTSIGLHQLLLHYGHRAAAHRAAWTKFAISRLGDAFLVGALVLTFQSFGTFELSELFASVKDLAAASQLTDGHVAIGWLLVLGAVTKSAQFPFHTWLPDTMETPTPVSALMHAGIVNAGGYLIIRMSPLVALAPTALVTLAVIGAFTAVFGGVVMMTQPSVKRALAYSTIAQMGFMMLQCGLGAFSAAMLHILTHAMYKAYAFLSSGSVVAVSSATAGAKSPSPSPRMNIACWLVAASSTVLAYFAISTALGLDASEKPGGVVLAFILCLALTTWGWRLFALGQRTTILAALAGVVAICLVYVASYLAVDHLIRSALPVVPESPAVPFVLVGITLCFCVLLALHALLLRRRRPGWLEPIRVHAANGFYVDALYQRISAALARP